MRRIGGRNRGLGEIISGGGGYFCCDYEALPVSIQELASSRVKIAISEDRARISDEKIAASHLDRPTVSRI